MAGDNREEVPDAGAGPPARSGPVSRRAMLRTAAGASAAGLMAGGALAALPAAAAARPGRPGQRTGRAARSAATATPDTTGGPGSTDGPLVIHVRDAHTGEMDIFSGTTQTRLRDPALAARLVRASQ
jgi:hypothetical protein